MDKPIIFFDGTCALCNSFVEFILKVDHKAVFLFSPLQGDHAKSLKLDLDIASGNFKSVVLYDEKGTHYGSNAVLRILGKLGGIWAALSLLSYLPNKPRDALYYFVAKNRHRWFGRRDYCRMPNQDGGKTRFLK